MAADGTLTTLLIKPNDICQLKWAPTEGQITLNYATNGAKGYRKHIPLLTTDEANEDEVEIEKTLVTNKIKKQLRIQQLINKYVKKGIVNINVR